MIENIKVDIIYFMTANDFEFEFNLGGCCRMRLLNDKADDKKSFVNSLARAVSRSQIILAVGPLFGEDGLITTCAAAISHGLVEVNNEAYGIAAEQKIKIIEGAVPLVTREGYFGGCIVESGNQSIIVLTENRTVRKAIMKNLVHPYIEDMCIMQSTGRSGISQIPEPVPQVKEQPAEDTLVPQEEIAAPQEPEQTEQTPADTAEPAEPVLKAPLTPGENSMEIEFFEPEDGEEEDEITAEVEPNTEDLYFVPEANEEEDDEPLIKSKKGRGLNITILIICAVLLLVVFAILYFLVFLPLVGGVSTTEYFKEIFNTVSKV